MKNFITRVTLKPGIALLFLASFIFFTACEEEDGIGTTINFEEGEESAFQAEESTENAFDVIESITTAGLRVSEANTGGRIVENTDPEFACAEVLFEGTRESGRLEINFGEGCEGPDGKVRKGTIVIEYVGHWYQPGAKVYTVLKDFYLDDLKIMGTRILKNISLNQEALVYSVSLEGGKIMWPDETYLTRECDRTQTLKFGETIEDFELEVEGVAAGMTREGVEYVTEIIEPLVFKSSCRGNTIYIPVSGIKTITIPEKREITINYGEKDCDSKFIISIGEESAEKTI